jgi:hypothetical protein
MSNLHLITSTNAIEVKLSRMRELNQSIKELQAEFDMLKSEVVESYLGVNEEYRTNKGLLLATYKPQISMLFQQSKFKLDHPDVFSLYQEEKTIYRFLLK